MTDDRSVEPFDDRSDDPFVAAHERLVGIAYRLVGTFADAHDVVQEAWFRWQSADQDAIDNPDAWLTTVVTRIALDHLRRRKREQAHYVGPWLPAPMVEWASDRRVPDPEASAELADSMTLAFLVLLERLTPDERAAFLLADVFGEPFELVARTMDRSAAACRQLASRARRKLREEGAERAGELATDRDVVDRFLVAIATGDEADAVACVRHSAVLTSDGGPHRRAARRPVLGPDRIVRLVASLARRLPTAWTTEPASVGGLPGIVVVQGDGTLYLAMGFEVRDGLIDRVFSVLNPEKLPGSPTGDAPAPSPRRSDG